MINIASDTSSSTLTDIIQEDIQPNAVDVKIGKIFKLSNDTFVIDSENNKTHRSREELLPDNEGFWILEPGSYEIVMSNTIKVGEDEAGWVIPRSSFNRNGIFLTSGLYDSGYNGVVASCMHITCGNLKIQKNTRIGQILMFKAQALFKYNGSYGFGSKFDKVYGTQK